MPDATGLNVKEKDANGLNDKEKEQQLKDANGLNDKEVEQQTMKDLPGYVGGMFEVENGLNTISAPEWITIEVVMDSGAAESVAPADLAPWIPVQESPGSRRGPVVSTLLLSARS